MQKTFEIGDQCTLISTLGPYNYPYKSCYSSLCVCDTTDGMSVRAPGAVRRRSKGLLMQHNRTVRDADSEYLSVCRSGAHSSARTRRQSGARADVLDILAAKRQHPRMERPLGSGSLFGPIDMKLFHLLHPRVVMVTRQAGYSAQQAPFVNFRRRELQEG
jgi:hypothetical protein